MARTTSFGADQPATIRFPDGAVIPDWSAVITASARKALKAVFDAFVEPKWRGMDAVESQVRERRGRRRGRRSPGPGRGAGGRPGDLRADADGDAAMASDLIVIGSGAAAKVIAGRPDRS